MKAGVSFVARGSRGGGGGGYSHIHAIWACAAVKGMVFKLFSLG